MTKETFVKELTFLQQTVQEMREEGDVDLRTVIMHIENLIMAVENN